MHTGSGTSHAKIIMIGEHAVVFGEPAIALPIPTIRLRATVTPAAHGQMVTSAFYNGSLAAAADTNFVGIATLMRQLLHNFDAIDQPFVLDIVSDLPPERGMGSSAATAIAVVRAFYDAFGAAIDRATVLRWADVSEHIIHGNPSGIDAATASADHPQWIIKGQAPRPIASLHQGALVIADSGIQGQTRAAVTAVTRLREQDPDMANTAIHALGQLTRQAALTITNQDVPTLGKIMAAAQVHLRRLGVSTPVLDRLITVADAAGSYGTKLTGGGMGGCIIALTPDMATGQHVAQQLEAAGAPQTWIHDFGANDDQGAKHA
ncbi:mevalonate kinase [Lacticaseibacillus thailandensis]|uniref:Mevalonate kinase n=1 Tax=Lacticaseibacillus thailandensis DSM 22698 = JCM 13996 TaxID=1423810 RepID=A0A0R2C965_9LACO|nr:mevalonate kinase [Lacticaseibacillus thailandensis]KRM88119.1 mevalonate kinase [Lacticaseibacillus thailandensis DSM 22698 = JCM 13996]